LSKKKLLGLALFTLVIFPLIGHILIYFFKEGNFALIYRAQYSLGWQLYFGLLSGFVFGLLAWFISTSKWVSPTSTKYIGLIGNLNLNHFDIILISLCAGIGEELLFRGALQPLIGIWITAIFFVLIHGYLDPRDWRISLYGISMTFIIAILGYMTEALGIWSAAISHAMIDYVLLQQMNRKWKARRKELTIHWDD